MSDKGLSESVTFDAKPYAFTFPVKHTALLVIDMQRDFICAGGFGEIQGGNLEAVQASIAPTRTLLKACRRTGLKVFHTREGHVPSLADCPSSKLIRQAAAPENSQHFKVIGDKGEMGRLLVRGEYGHEIVHELQPLPSEVVIDKPGKGSFWNTPIMHKLKANDITHLLVSGITTECCFSTTIREANDRGFECCGIVESTAGYNSSFKTASLDMISWSQGLFGFVGQLQPLLDALSPWQSKTLDISTPPQTPPIWNGRLDIESLRKSFESGVSPVTVAEAIYDRIEKYQKIDPAVWIKLESKDTVLGAARRLAATDRSRLPALYGVPFSVKDSIDVQGVETTVACPPLAFVASTSAPCYDKVIAQGALYLGKVNLDQYATGLSGCRSPYGITHSVFSKDHISGGSSSGSAVSVGADLVSFSLATDTAGSGRVPSGLNGCVGYKPTRGQPIHTLSMRSELTLPRSDLLRGHRTCLPIARLRRRHRAESHRRKNRLQRLRSLRSQRSLRPRLLPSRTPHQLPRHATILQVRDSTTGDPRDLLFSIPHPLQLHRLQTAISRRRAHTHRLDTLPPRRRPPLRRHLRLRAPRQLTR
jgi:nicotinamidase-related amidase